MSQNVFVSTRFLYLYRYQIIANCKINKLTMQYKSSINSYIA